MHCEELLYLGNAEVEAAIRTIWKDLVEESESESKYLSNLQADRGDVFASSMQEWNDLSKVLMDESESDDLRLEMQGGSEDLFLEDAEGQSSEWLKASQDSQASYASIVCSDMELGKWKAAAAAYSSLVEEVLEICDDRPDMSVQAVSLVEGWQRKQAENPEVAGTEALLMEMADTTQNLIKSRAKKFTKSSLKCLFEQAWEQKIEESTKERTPWTNCEILYRRCGPLSHLIID